MLPNIEVVRFRASEALQKDLSTIEPLLNGLAKVPGAIASYYGLAVEDGTTMVLIVVWETYEDYTNFTKSPEFEVLVALMKPCVGGDISTKHITFSKDATNALGAPTTEVVFSKDKGTATKEEVEKLFFNLNEGLDKAKGNHPPSVWGAARDDPKTLNEIVGWDTVEAHTTAVSEGSLQAIVQGIVAALELEIFHLHLKKHPA